MKFEVSVIIPVYNAAKYVTQAVESAVNLPEVMEIVLVEDRSPDNALEICQALAAKYTKVKLLQHPNGENRGAGASRNLGIVNASAPYIAFLDADDLYLPNRFAVTRQVFENNPDAEGVYCAAGFVKNEKRNTSRLYTIRRPLVPAELFSSLVKGTHGHFHTLGITLKKSAFDKTGLFNPDLRLGQDADLWLRLAYHCKLYPGELNNPVSLIRRHDENRIRQTNHLSKIKGLRIALQYFSDKKVTLRDYWILVFKLYRYYLRHAMVGPAIKDFHFWFKL